MHIALVNQWYPPETGGGGVATHNYYFANACVQLGHKVTVIAQKPKDTTPAERLLNGVRVLRVPSPDLYRLRRLPLVGRQYRFVQALMYSRVVCRALADVNRADPVDVAEFAEVNAEGFFWRQNLSRCLAVRCHTPAWVLARYYGPSEMPYDASLLGQLEKRVIRRANVLTAPSRDMAQVITTDCNLPPECVYPIPNALDMNEFHPGILDGTRDRVTVLWVGRLERAKGADVLIDAIPEVCARVPQVRFVTVGGARGHPQGGTYHDFMRRQLAPQIAAGQVEIRGFVPDESILDAYHESDISVVPSLLYESFSFTVAQSMACGLPVIASDIAGIPETVAYGQCGVLIKPGDVQELIRAIVDLVHDSTARQALGQAAHAHALANFASEVVAERILALYRRTLSA